MHRQRAYTLIEVLMVVTVLGIAATMVVPTFSQSNPLRIQAAVRTVVSDITQAQSDAVAMQIGQAIEFTADSTHSRYTICPVSGTALDTSPDVIVTRQIGGHEFGEATIANIQLPNNQLIFDAMGGPVQSPGSDIAATTGSVDIVSGSQSFRITIEAYTGRVTVSSIPNPS